MSDPVTLWQHPAPGGDVRCTLAQIGEGEFELHLWAGSTLLLTEDFDSEEQVLVRAEELERQEGEVHS